MDFGRDAPMVRKIRWYFTKPGADLFPGACFGSSNWDPVPRQNPLRGEQGSSSFKYDKGTSPPDATGLFEVCGDPRWFSEGVPAGTPPLVMRLGRLPTCCSGGDGLLVGGVTESYLGSSALTGSLFGGRSLSAIYRTSVVGLRAGSSDVPQLLRASAGGSTLGAYRIPPSGFLGLKTGLRGLPRLPIPASLGARLGVVGLPRIPLSGALGVKVSPAATLRTPLSGTIGVKLGLSYSFPVTLIQYPGTMGAKVGMQAGPLQLGTVTTCCGNPIPNSLGGTDSAGAAVTLTYTAAAAGWEYVDSLYGVTCVLRCTAGAWYVGPVNAPKCTSHVTVSHLVCFPFSITLNNNLTGALCLQAGNYVLTAHS
jgi:hypothetical protein